MFTKSTHLCLGLAIILCINLVNCVSHSQQTRPLEDIQFGKLTEQQKSLQTKINTLLQDMLNVQKNVSKATNATDKVILLEQAILSERQKVFNMQNQLIPPFSFSRTACLQLTNEQKIQMLDRIKATKQELTNLQKQVASAPKCDKTSSLQKDTQKQLILLQSLEKTIYTDCKSKSVLTPTIYQTNIYADGWILGDQNIDDLIEEYYQRNIRYHNITNCPLEKPFFNGDECMNCYQPTPVYNILTRECTVCPPDQEPDSSIRQCAWRPHYTNFTSVQNWAQEGAPMPSPSKQLLPCPPQKPYYNGKKCQVCMMPKYWSIKKNACVECPLETIFDVNDKKCEKPESYDLTVLQGTRWVTNDCNLTRIVEERVKILNINKTKQYYRMCPPQKPFYDGIVCINCPNQFNIDTKRCVSSPNKTALYNQNVRCYVEKQSGFQTDPRAVNYTSKSPLIDSQVPNCRKATPYYDGIACIDCLDPFPIFNVDKKRCTACDPMEVYNNTQHLCLPRKKIYISTNENNLIATPIMSIDDYHAEIAQKIKQNPEAVVLLCKDPQYSDYTKCFNCSANEYFNVQTKKCQTCDGTINQTTKVCNEKQYIYTNLNSDSTKRIVGIPTTIQQQNATIQDKLKLHNTSRLCPTNQPYFNGKVCTNCTKQSFNYTSLQCVPMQCTSPQFPFYNNVTDQCQQCPKNTRYVEKTKKCQPIVYVTNTNAMFFYIEEGNATKANLEDEIFDLEADHAVITCDASHPYYNGTDCIDCAISRNVSQVGVHKPFFNLRSLKCQACSKWDNVTHKCLDGKTCQDPTPILDPATNSCIACPTGSIYNPQTLKCEACSQNQIFNPKTQKCETWVTRIASLDKNYIEQGNGTKANLNAKIEDIKSKTKDVFVCPTETPFFSKVQGKCISCSDPTPYFNILTETCKSCDNYNLETNQCDEALPRFKMNVEDFYGTIFQ